jgi:aryl-alcohol dehydrogenase (NADP+)
LLYREEEREMIPFCKAHNIGYMAYGPNAAGVLSGKYYKDGKLIVDSNAPERLRPETGFYPYKLYIELPDNAEIVRRVIEVAKNKDATPSQIAVAWVLHKEVIAIVGTSKVEHLEEYVGALDIKLKEDEIKYLEEPYKPKPVLHIVPPPAISHLFKT